MKPGRSKIEKSLVPHTESPNKRYFYDVTIEVRKRFLFEKVNPIHTNSCGGNNLFAPCGVPSIATITTDNFELGFFVSEEVFSSR